MSIYSDLRALRAKAPEVTDVEGIMEQTTKIGNDRGAALLSAVLLQNILAYAVKRRLFGDNIKLQSLFENDGPLSTFDSCVNAGYALAIFGNTTKKDLTTIKHIRNTFAHSNVPISFKTPEIIAACEYLTNTWTPTTDPHMRFIGSCNGIARSLAFYAASCIYAPADAVAPTSLVAMVPATPSTLP